MAIADSQTDETLSKVDFSYIEEEFGWPFYVSTQSPYVQSLHTTDSPLPHRSCTALRCKSR